MSDRETVLRRVKKLLALSRSPNQHEAETAAAMAQRLVQEHKVEDREIEEEQETTIFSWSYASRAVFWKRDLAFAVARGFFCRCVHTPPSKEAQGKAWLNLVGKREDIEVAREVFDWLLRELRRLSVAFVKVERVTWKRGIRKASMIYARDEPVWTKVKLDFLNGAVYAVDQRMIREHERFQAEAEKCRALVKAGDEKIMAFIHEQFQKVEPSPTGAPVREYAAWAAGVKAGEEVVLKPAKGIGGGE